MERILNDTYGNFGNFAEINRQMALHGPDFVPPHEMFGKDNINKFETKPSKTSIDN